MLLYRPVGLQELELIYDSGMKAFPTRLPQQPIFYPVLQLEYARQIAADWNAKSGPSAGYVTEFRVENDYISQFETHTVGGSQHQELWIPAEDLEEFNKHITGHIKVVEAHFGNTFQGFIPEKFRLQGKNAVEQFTLLTDSYLYKRMDFFLEIKRNHKAVFLNYPFWQMYELKNPGLKEKVMQAIKEAWLTSFPQIPLPLPVQKDTPPAKKTDASSLVKPAVEETPSAKPKESRSLVRTAQEDITRVEPTDAQASAENLENPVDEEITHDAPLPVNLDEKEITPVEPVNSPPPQRPVQQEVEPLKQTASHLAQGLELGLSGQYREAIDELSKAVEEDPDYVAAQVSLGVAYHRLGQDDRALACYETALKIDPIYAEAHYFRANILYSRGNIREAIAGYTMAIGLQPELIEAHQKATPRDRLTDYTGSPAEMHWIAKPAGRILDLNKSLESNPEHANLFKERAAEYYRLWNYAQAIADYNLFLAIQPDDADTLHLRGLAYEQLGKFDRALQDYQRAIAIDPQLSNVYINRGVTFGKMGNYRQAIASLSEAIRLAPQNPDGYFNRGTSYLQLGDLQNAIADFSNAIQLSPTDEEAYYLRGISNEAAGHRQDASVDYRQFLALSKDVNARPEIEQKLKQWNAEKQKEVSTPSAPPDDRQKTDQTPAQGPDQELDLYGLVVALGERALRSTWFGRGVECYGETAEELYTLMDQDQPVEGQNFLQITSSIRQTVAGDFQAFDPGTDSPWVFIRAWEGSGFYLETNDPQIKARLTSYFPSIEEVEGATPSYKGLFIRI